MGKLTLVKKEGGIQFIILSAKGDPFSIFGFTTEWARVIYLPICLESKIMEAGIFHDYRIYLFFFFLKTSKISPNKDRILKKQHILIYRIY